MMYDKNIWLIIYEYVWICTLCACWITSPSFDILWDEVLEVYFHHLMMWCLRSDIASYAEEDVYKPRQGVDGVKGRGPQRLTSWGWWRLVVRWSFLEAFRWHGFLALHPGWKLCHGGQWKVGDPWSKWDRRVDVYITVYIDKFQSHRRFSAIGRSWQTFFFLGTRLAVPAKVRSSKLLFDGMGCSRHILLSDIIWPAR